MRSSDWSSDVCSSDLPLHHAPQHRVEQHAVADGAAEPRAGREIRVDMDRIVVAADLCEQVAVGLGKDAVEAEAGHGGARGYEGLPARWRSRCFWIDRKSVVEGKSVSGRVDLGGRRTTKNKNK